jgi:CBS domain-containing protein
MYEFIYYQVRHVMTADPIVVDQDATLSEVEAIFEEYDFNGLPVVDETSRLMGMITKLDFLKAFDFTKKNKVPHYVTIMAQNIREVMTKDLEAVYPETPLPRLLHLMIETGYKSFPVVRNHRLVGIVAREDIIGALKRGAQGLLPLQQVSSSTERHLA